MKNLKIYKPSIAIVTAASILLMSGCSSNNNDNNNNNNKTSSPCTHLTIYFEDQPITFKACDDYDIYVRRYGRSSEINYNISKNNEEILSGTTTMYNAVDVYHNNADELLELETTKKVK